MKVLKLHNHHHNQISVIDEPADLANFPPFPGINSTLCIDVPGGISFNSRQLPILISTFLPDSIVSPFLNLEDK